MNYTDNYNKRNYTLIGFRINTETDDHIAEWLNCQPSKADAIRQAITDRMELTLCTELLEYAGVDSSVDNIHHLMDTDELTLNKATDGHYYYWYCAYVEDATDYCISMDGNIITDQETIENLFY